MWKLAAARNVSFVCACVCAYMCRSCSERRRICACCASMRMRVRVRLIFVQREHVSVHVACAYLCMLTCVCHPCSVGDVTVPACGCRCVHAREFMFVRVCMCVRAYTKEACKLANCAKLYVRSVCMSYVSACESVSASACVCVCVHACMSLRVRAWRVNICKLCKGACWLMLLWKFWQVNQKLSCTCREIFFSAVGPSVLV